MADQTWLAAQFEESRSHLRAVAYRMLGSMSEADDPVLRADRAAVQMGASGEVRGSASVGETFSGRARFAQPALIQGTIGAVWAPGGLPRFAFEFTIAADKIVTIHLLADPEVLGKLDLAVLDD